MRNVSIYALTLSALGLLILAPQILLHGQGQAAAAIQFTLKPLPFHLENDATRAKNVPETMAGGVAVFDYNGDGRPDIFFTNGADLSTLRKSSPKYSNRLFRNDGNGKFTDVTTAAGLAGIGFDTGVAVADYDNDGFPDIFVASVHRNTLYHNNGDGTFTDVTKKAGLDKWNDPEFGPLWAITAAWVDVNNDGLLDLFVVNYLQWNYSATPLCVTSGVADYCHPRYYKGLPNQLFLNQGDGTFKDVSKEWGLRDQIGKGMGAGVADYDLDGKPDIFVPNDAGYNFLFHNLGNKFEEVAFQTNVALPEDGAFISGMGLDFRDVNNDGFPDIAYVALNNQTFPMYFNTGKGDFVEVTAPSGIRAQSLPMMGFGAALYDFDNDGWKDMFVTRGSVVDTLPPGAIFEEPNSVFRNLGAIGKFKAFTAEAGFTASSAARHRGCAFGEFNSDGLVDVVATGLGKDAELWMNTSPHPGHWLDFALHGVKSNRDGLGARIKVVTKAGTQYNHMTSSVCYASSSLGPVHFGLGAETVATKVEIVWPSGTVQTLDNVAADQILKVTEPPSAPTTNKQN
jgi:enediyne biosynthesis protein E4